MISDKSRTREWILEIRKNSRVTSDPILIEKMIFALTLLENLHATGLDFTFKGGTSLLLVTGTLTRFSIDIDIVLESNEGLDDALQSIIQQGVFHRFEEIERKSNVPKCHFKFYFKSVVQDIESYILLDILFGKNHYPQCQKITLKSSLVEIEGGDVKIKCPAPECLLGDKLTAFAPHTTGIPYQTDKDLQIIKQLHDIGLLFNIVSDINLVRDTFHNIAAIELAFRGLKNLSSDDVLSDCIDTACLIGMRGFGAKENEYVELQDGISKLAGYVYTERFTQDSAILCAAKVAYIVSLIRKDDSPRTLFDPNTDLTHLVIQKPEFRRLNRLKKSNLKAFYYFYRAIEG